MRRPFSNFRSVLRLDKESTYAAIGGALGAFFGGKLALTQPGNIGRAMGRISTDPTLMKQLEALLAGVIPSPDLHVAAAPAYAPQPGAYIPSGDPCLACSKPAKEHVLKCECGRKLTKSRNGVHSQPKGCEKHLPLLWCPKLVAKDVSSKPRPKRTRVGVRSKAATVPSDPPTGTA